MGNQHGGQSLQGRVVLTDEQKEKRRQYYLRVLNISIVSTPYRKKHTSTSRCSDKRRSELDHATRQRYDGRNCSKVSRQAANQPIETWLNKLIVCSHLSGMFTKNQISDYVSNTVRGDLVILVVYTMRRSAKFQAWSPVCVNVCVEQANEETHQDQGFAL